MEAEVGPIEPAAHARDDLQKSRAGPEEGCPTLVEIVLRGSGAAPSFASLGMYRSHTAGKSMLPQGRSIDRDFRKRDEEKSSDAAR